MDPYIVGAAGATAAVGALLAALFRRRALAAETRARASEAKAARMRDELFDERLAVRKDPVTGLFNRKGFGELAAALTADPDRWPLVALVADVDNLRPATVFYGQSTGDQLLAAVGRRLADYAAGPAVARLDGGRFAALLTSSISGDGSHFPHMRELLKLLSEPVWVAGRLVRPRIRLGIAPVEGTDLAKALAKAEAAMRRGSIDQLQAAKRADLAPVYYRSRVVARHPRRPRERTNPID